MIKGSIRLTLCFSGASAAVSPSCDLCHEKQPKPESSKTSRASPGRAEGGQHRVGVPGHQGGARVPGEQGPGDQPGLGLAWQADQGLCLSARGRGGKRVGRSKPRHKLSLEAEDFLARGGGGGQGGQGVLAHGEGPTEGWHFIIEFRRTFPHVGVHRLLSPHWSFSAFPCKAFEQS